MSPDPTIQRVQSPGHVEQSVSIDSNVSHKKQQGLQSKRKKRRRRRTPDEHLGDEQFLQDTTNDTDEHIDYRA